MQERAKLLDEEIGATQDQFDKIMEHLKLEHQRKTEDLKSDLDAVQMVIKTEDRLFGSAAELQSESLSPQYPCWQQAQSRQSASAVQGGLAQREEMEAMR